ncbi:triose-phosphate isomerase [Capillibacterium thermochitinicola]|uniref:Triosephosphate isomerase n=1 Tax=Capillibacterium thermochitinicola TaxID=2699427 RepID=A0A8J6LIG9_9FIRM|nr:triose-phosphate isomerase [Capillibacterium thermochitinicola]
MRKPIIAGNWKMYKTNTEARALVNGLKEKTMPAAVEVVLCPPFTALTTVAELLQGTAIGLGAQDLFWEDEGAYTGEVSPLMLKELGCSYVIIGHSERRQYFGETDETVNKKVKAALRHGLKPIICVGESLQQREAGETNAFVAGQVEKALDGLAPESIPQVVIAYEPIWAIGTGRSSSGSDANEVIGLVRQTIAKKFGSSLAEQVRIQYGGSVKPGNIKEFMDQPEIDGALVGGASLKAEDFYGIISY